QPPKKGDKTDDGGKNPPKKGDDTGDAPKKGSKGEEGDKQPPKKGGDTKGDDGGKKKVEGPPYVTGDVMAVDAAKNTITIEFKGRNQPFSLTDDATVEIDGKKGKLADVPVGTTTTLILTSVVRSIKATRPE